MGSKLWQLRGKNIPEEHTMRNTYFFTQFTQPITLVLIALFSLFTTQSFADDANPFCALPEPGNLGDITGAGAHFSWIVFNELKDELEKKSGRKITLYGKDSAMGAGCNAGIKNALQNKPGHETFGFVCCPLSDEEVTKKKIKVHKLALEPILILTHNTNPVTNLSQETIRSIFKGDIKNWKEVGGKDQAIVVVTRQHCKKRPGHWKTILPTKKAFSKDRINVKSADEMVRRVSDFPGAIGHTGATWIFEIGSQTKTIKVSGMEPSADNLKAKKYPFYRTLSAVTDMQPSQCVKNMISEVQTGSTFRTIAKRFELLPLN